MIPGDAARRTYNKGDGTHSLVDSIDEIPSGQGGVINRGKAKTRHLQSGQRARSCAVGVVHTRGLHRQLEQCRSDLGLSVPRLGILGHRTSHSRPGHQAFTVEKIGKSQAEAAAKETQSAPKELG